VAYNDGPIALRYPRGEGLGIDLPAKGKALKIGKGRIVKQGSDIAILSYGTRLSECLKAADILETKGKSVTVADARFAKPLDTDLIDQLVQNHTILLTVEEGSMGGFGAFVLQYLAESGQLSSGCKIMNTYLPDDFMDHDSPDKQYDKAELSAQSIARKIQFA
jgi:1-deoxy-D-xylulose-5-phosphate synthase